MKIKQLRLGPMETNCYLLIEEKTGEAALIDCPCVSPELDAFVNDPEVKKLKYLLLTHGHYDHILGLPHMKDKTGAAILIHQADAFYLKNPKYSLAVFAGLEQTELEPDRTLTDGDTLPLGTLEIHVIHTPGHTPGGVCYQVEDVMFTGDTLFCGTIGATHFPGGNETAFIQSVQRLAALPGDYNIYPGHDAVTTLARERAANPYCRM